MTQTLIEEKLQILVAGVERSSFLKRVRPKELLPQVLLRVRERSH